MVSHQRARDSLAWVINNDNVQLNRGSNNNYTQIELLWEGERSESRENNKHVPALPR